MKKRDKIPGGQKQEKVVDGALDGTIVTAQGKVAIFISHTWWDRTFVDESNNPEDKYDRGAPDYMADYGEEERKDVYQKKQKYNREKGLKHKIICLGVDNLIKQDIAFFDSQMVGALTSRMTTDAFSVTQPVNLNARG